MLLLSLYVIVSVVCPVTLLLVLCYWCPSKAFSRIWKWNRRGMIGKLLKSTSRFIARFYPNLWLSSLIHVSNLLNALNPTPGCVSNCLNTIANRCSAVVARHFLCEHDSILVLRNSQGVCNLVHVPMKNCRHWFA